MQQLCNLGLQHLLIKLYYPIIIFFCIKTHFYLFFCIFIISHWGNFISWKIDIATQAGNIFDKSQNLELKRILLKFVFESLTLTEGVLTYKLKFLFNEFVNSNILMAQATKSYELAESLKNKRLAKNFASLLQIGEQESTKIGSKSVININFFVEHRSEILAMKEQVQMIRSFIHA